MFRVQSVIEIVHVAIASRDMRQFIHDRRIVREAQNISPNDASKIEGEQKRCVARRELPERIHDNEYNIFNIGRVLLE